MRYVFITLFTLLCMADNSAHADLFVKKDPAARSKSVQPFVLNKDRTIERALDLDDTTPQSEAPQNVKQLANQYYLNCIKTPPGIMRISSLKALCGCTASEMAEVMSADEIRLMYEPTPEGEYQRQRMMGLVYVPCMKYPVEDLVRNNCISQREIREGLKHASQVCSCLGREMAEYATITGAARVQFALNNPEDGLDVEALLVSLMSGKNFQRKSELVIRSCMRKHELGWE